MGHIRDNLKHNFFIILLFISSNICFGVQSEVSFNDSQQSTLIIFFLESTMCSPFITLCLASIRIDHIISESRYKGKILQKKFNFSL